MKDRYKYYWNKKQFEDSNKPLDWDKIIQYVIVYPSAVVFAFIYILSKVYRE